MSIQLYLLGHPQIIVADTPISLPRSKALALLAYLAVTNQVHHRDTLATLLWPDYDQSSGRGELRRQISTLKKSLPDHILHVERDSLGIHIDAPLWLDVAVLRNLSSQCDVHIHHNIADCPACADRLKQMHSLLRGGFMDGFTIPDSPEYDQWQHQEAQALFDIAQHALDDLAQHYLAADEGDQALSVLRQLVSLNPGYEQAHRQIMTYLAQQGRRGDALAQYEQCVAFLNQEFGVAPDTETQQLFYAIRNQKEIKSTHATNHKPSPGRIALPSAPLIGRVDDLKQVVDYIHDPACHLITITGMGGVGKTHLALEATRHVNDVYPSIMFISLEGVETRHFINHIADKLNFTASPRDNLYDGLLGFLRTQRFLLILDGFEAHIQNADFVNALTEHAPDVMVMVTSRQRLNLGAEHIVMLQVLDAPSADTITPQDTGAFQLFQAYAQRANQNFIPDETYITQICRLSGGLPLALELAASWTRSLSLEQIAHELQRDLTLLGELQNKADGLDRVFARSWSILAPEQQTTLTQLTIFPDSFSTEAALNITQVALSTIQQLVEMSLLAYDRLSNRYHIHSVLKAYITANTTVDNVTIARYVAYYAQFITDRLSQLRCRDMSTIAEVERELSNITCAVDHALTQEAIAHAHELSEGLYQLYESKSWAALGLNTFEDIISRVKAYLDGEPEDIQQARDLLARLTSRYAILHFYIGQYDTAETLLNQYVKYWRSTNNKVELSLVLNSLGIIHSTRHRTDEAVGVLEEALALRQALNDEIGIARVYNTMGINALISGNAEQGHTYLMQALTVYTAYRDHIGIARACINLGSLALSQAHYDDARRYFERARKLQKQYGFDSLPTRASTAVNIAIAAKRQNRHDEAQQKFYESYTLFKAIGNAKRAIYALLDLAEIAIESEKFVLAQRYLTEALQMTNARDDDYSHAHVLLGWIPVLMHLEDQYRAQIIAQALSQSETTEIANLAEEQLKAHFQGVDAQGSGDMKAMGLEIMMLYGDT